MRPKLIIVNVKSGFSNRIIPILSIYSFCKKNNVPLEIIWEKNTCRSQIPNTNKQSHYTLEKYYKSLPISTHKLLSSVLTKYHINNLDIFKVDMKWTNKVTFEIYNHDYVMLDNVCHILCLDKQYNTDIFYPHPIKTINKLYDNKYLWELNKYTNEFVLCNELNNIISNLGPFDIGIHIRTSDGGFAKYNSKLLIKQAKQICEENKDKKIFLCSDTIDISNIFKIFNNVTQYNNKKKFDNNDTGTYYSLIDLYTLSKCKIMHCTPGSSFSFLSYIINDNKRKELIYFSIFT